MCLFSRLFSLSESNSKSENSRLSIFTLIISSNMMNCPWLRTSEI